MATVERLHSLTFPRRQEVGPAVLRRAGQLAATVVALTTILGLVALVEWTCFRALTWAWQHAVQEVMMSRVVGIQ